MPYPNRGLLFPPRANRRISSLRDIGLAIAHAALHDNPIRPRRGIGSLSRILRTSHSSRTSWSTSRQALDVGSLAQTPANPGISPKHVPLSIVLNRALLIASWIYRVNISLIITRRAG